MRRYTAILCLVLAVGCGDDDSDGPPQDNRLHVTITQPGSPVSGVVDITFTLTQRQDIPGDVIPEYSTDGGQTFRRATATPLTQVRGLASAKDVGVSHIFPWDTRADGLAFTVPETNVVFRMIPMVNGAVGAEDETAPFVVSNSAARLITAITPDAQGVGGMITIDGQGFSLTPGDNIVIFGDYGGAAIPVPALTATASQITVDVPDPSPLALRDISGPITVTVLGDTTNALQFVAITPGSPRVSIIAPTSIEGNFLPWFGGAFPGVRVQYYLRPGEIGNAGVIDSLQWGTATGLSETIQPDTTVGSVRVRMAHTSFDSLTPFQEWNYDVAPPKEVAFISSYSIPGAVTGFIDLPLSGTFTYNGRDALIVEIEGTGSSGPFFGLVGRRPEGRRSWQFTSKNFGMDILMPALALGFQETDTDDAFSLVMGANAYNLLAACAPPFCDPFYCNVADCGPYRSEKLLPQGGSRIQLLYREREIAQAGVLKGIAWKPATTSVAATYDNLAVRVTQVTGANLGPPFETSLTEVRAPATYVVPGGETDFIPIPLDAPYTFTYDGLSHLLVEITIDSGTALNPVDAMAIPPSTRMQWAASPTATTGQIRTDIVSLRLDFD